MPGNILLFLLDMGNFVTTAITNKELKLFGIISKIYVF